jgi:hypothetical protein
MFLIVKDNKFNTDNIEITLHNIYNFYHIFYKNNYIKLSGIPISIKYNKIIEKNNRYFIYFDEDNDIIEKINIWLNSKIENFYFIRYDINNNKKYIIANYYMSNLDIQSNNNIIDLIIYKIKYIKGKYIPIINII